MKVGDIKIEAIKLMFTNYSFDMAIEDLQRMISDENYGSYIVNMNGAISRALDRIENACVVPTKSRLITDDELTVGTHFSRFDLSKVEDLFVIDRVSAEYANGEYDGSASYELEGNELLLEKANADYRIIYYPKLKTMDDTVQDNDEMWLPDNIARLIPYFIKGDLYQEEEPNLAADARNIFEACLDDLKAQTQSKQNYIYQVYRME